MNLDRALNVSAAGMAVQSTRLRVVAENIANHDTTATVAGGDPYRRKTVSFENHLDRATGASIPEVSKVGTSSGAFPERYDPSHPAADARGYVRLPNVDMMTEVMDMREAQRSYSANLSVLETTRSMLLRAIDSLRG
jgi:flagellar basal-body rod protein FlgC